HAVGPRMGEGDEDNKLKNAVLSSLMLASQKNLKSISFPAISSGIFGFPKDRCAQILVGESARFLREQKDISIHTVEFCIRDDSTLTYFKKEFEKLV
ncbi:MAG TPA: macro domain-containing protein, partial [Candidatus Omnitrophica bacterium]|nr:macro domain-containing protein [Candidatus Omnitrophota bacterium]